MAANVAHIVTRCIAGAGGGWTVSLILGGAGGRITKTEIAADPFLIGGHPQIQIDIPGLMGSCARRKFILETVI